MEGPWSQRPGWSLCPLGLLQLDLMLAPMKLLQALLELLQASLDLLQTPLEPLQFPLELALQADISLGAGVTNM